MLYRAIPSQFLSSLQKSCGGRSLGLVAGVPSGCSALLRRPRGFATAAAQVASSAVAREATEYLKYLRERQRRKEVESSGKTGSSGGSSSSFAFTPASAERITTFSQLAKEAHSVGRQGVVDVAFWDSLQRTFRQITATTFGSGYDARAALHFVWVVLEMAQETNREVSLHEETRIAFFNQVLGTSCREQVVADEKIDVLSRSFYAHCLRLTCDMENGEWWRSAFVERLLQTPPTADQDSCSALASAVWSEAYVLCRRFREASPATSTERELKMKSRILDAEFLTKEVVPRLQLRAENAEGGGGSFSELDRLQLVDACVAIADVFKNKNDHASSGIVRAGALLGETIVGRARNSTSTCSTFATNCSAFTVADCAKALHGLAKLRADDAKALERVAGRLRDLFSSLDTFTESCRDYSVPESGGRAHRCLLHVVLAVGSRSGLSSPKNPPPPQLPQHPREMKAEAGGEIWSREAVPRLLATIAYGFAKGRGTSSRHSGELFDRLGVFARRNLHDFGVRDAGQLLTSFARAGVTNAVLVARVAGKVKQWGGRGILEQLRDAEPSPDRRLQSALNLAMGLAKFQCRDEKVFKACLSPVFRSFLPPVGGAEEATRNCRDHAGKMLMNSSVATGDEGRTSFHAAGSSGTNSMVSSFSTADDVFGLAADGDPTQKSSPRQLRRQRRNAAQSLSPEEKLEHGVEELAAEFWPANGGVGSAAVSSADWVNVVQAYGKVHVLDETLVTAVCDLLYDRVRAGVIMGMAKNTMGSSSCVAGGDEVLVVIPTSDVLKLVNALGKLNCPHKPLLNCLIQQLRRDVDVEKELSPFDALQLSQALARLGVAWEELEGFVGTVLPNEIRTSSGCSEETRRRMAVLPKHRKSARKRKRTW
eukprot:g3923.t1